MDEETEAQRNFTKRLIAQLLGGRTRWDSRPGVQFKVVCVCVCVYVFPLYTTLVLK